MSAARARRIAEAADKPTYFTALSDYAEMDADALRAAASTAVLGRAQFTEPIPD